MRKFRTKSDFSIIWLQRAIDAGLGDDFVVIDEPLGLGNQSILSAWRAWKIVYLQVTLRQPVA
jgi:hypothetical protein